LAFVVAFVLLSFCFPFAFVISFLSLLLSLLLCFPFAFHSLSFRSSWLYSVSISLLVALVGLLISTPRCRVAWVLGFVRGLR
jgi:hypothetical protein